MRDHQLMCHLPIALDETTAACTCMYTCTLHKCTCTIIWFHFVLYLISYAAVRTKIKRTNIFNNEIFTRVSYTIWGAYENKTARNNNVRNIFNVKYNQITVCTCMYTLYMYTVCTTYMYIYMHRAVTRLKLHPRSYMYLTTVTIRRF